MCSYLTERHFQGFFVQGICISSWPLKVHPRAVSFWYVCKDVHKNMVSMGDIFSKIMKDAKVTLS